MGRPPKRNKDQEQLVLDFSEVIRTATVRSREDLIPAELPDNASADYSPVTQTADYVRRAIKFEEAWDTTINRARECLLKADAKTLYFEFLTDLANLINSQSPKTARLADMLRHVAYRGLGLTTDHVKVTEPERGGTRWRVVLDRAAILKYLSETVVGSTFLFELVADGSPWAGRRPLIGASDVSQHVSAVPIPARFFKRSVPFVLNNAAGALFWMDDNNARYDNLFNPEPDETLLRWMLIDPSYQDELEPEDYRRCLASAMDVGQYKFDLDYLLKANKRAPDVIFRDGSLFPQDAYLDNFAIENRRGDFTREAIREMLNCLSYVSQLRTTYCSVTKNVQLKVYSAVVDWYIARNIDSSWEVGSYTLNDGQSMSLLLSSPSFVEDNLQRVTATCLIRRSFTTRANLNTRISPNEWSTYFTRFQNDHPSVDISPYCRLCDIAHTYMFFMGHSKSPQQQLPRYEFFHHGSQKPDSIAASILAAIQNCSLMPDKDHSFMTDQPVTYLLPSVTQQAHILSKNVGRHIDSMTGQWIMAKYRQLLERLK
jgi:hypothetical protein